MLVIEPKVYICCSVSSYTVDGHSKTIISNCSWNAEPNTKLYAILEKGITNIRHEQQIMTEG